MSNLIVPCTEYTPLPKERFSSKAFRWLTPKKKPELVVKEQLPYRDRDELLRLWESTDSMLAGQRYPDQDDFKNVKRQMGKSMSHSELVRKVCALNKNLVVQDSTAMKGHAAFYFVNADKTLTYTNASFRKGTVPEFTIMTTDAADLPVHYPQYGWRTVLVRLLKGKYLEWNQVLRVFGDVKYTDSRGKHWFNNVRNFKN